MPGSCHCQKWSISQSTRTAGRWLFHLLCVQMLSQVPPPSSTQAINHSYRNCWHHSSRIHPWCHLISNINNQWPRQGLSCISRCRPSCNLSLTHFSISSRITLESHQRLTTSWPYLLATRCCRLAIGSGHFVVSLHSRRSGMLGTPTALEMEFGWVLGGNTHDAEPLQQTTQLVSHHTIVAIWRWLTAQVLGDRGSTVWTMQFFQSKRRQS